MAYSARSFMARLANLALVIAGTAASCSSGPTPPDASLRPAAGTHFASTPFSQALPSQAATLVAGQPFGYFDALTFIATAPNDASWQLLDLDGDGKPDLLSTDTLDSDGVAHVYDDATAPHWQYYRNSGTSFAEPVAWSVPDAAFTATGHDGTLAGDISWSTFDIDGDGKPDLVEFNQLDESGTPATFGLPTMPHWIVYLNTGTGFAAPINWTLSVLAQAGDFPTLSHDAVAIGDISWFVIDIDGDHRPDLVSPNQIVTEAGAPVPRPYGFPLTPTWLVFTNTGAGFAEPIDWQLPAVGGAVDGGFFARSYVGTALDDDSWTLFDITGDGRPDLVSSRQLVNEHDGAKQRVFGYPNELHWRIYRNSGSSFGAYSNYILPPNGGAADGGFATVSGTAAAVGDESWSMFDLDGDGRVDLVSTNHAVTAADGALTMATFGTPTAPAWRYYPNGGDGFGGGILWALPTTGGQVGAGFVAPDFTGVALGDDSWTTLDIDGDGRPDLVLTNQLVGTPTVATAFGFPALPHWLVYANTP